MTSPTGDSREPQYDEKHYAPEQAHRPRFQDLSEDTTVMGDSATGSNAFPAFDDAATIEKSTHSHQHQHHPSFANQGQEVPQDPRRLRVQTSMQGTFAGSVNSMKSPSQNREEMHRLEDDLRMFQVEQQISEIAAAEEKHAKADGDTIERTTTHASFHRERSNNRDIDEFDEATNPVHETAKAYRPPAHPTTALAKFIKIMHKKSFLIRYFTYITPVVLIILIPLLIGAVLPAAQNLNVGGVKMLWFCIWLEIVWLTLWAGRLIAKALPWPIGLISSLFTDNSKKWRDMVKQLEISATLFFWGLGVEISFLPTMKNHHISGNKDTKSWESTFNKIIVAFFVCAVLNFAEKIIIQLIAISFHERTYADRIEINKFQIGSLTKLYTYSKEKLMQADSDFEYHTEPASGARTPGQYLAQAQRGTTKAFNKFGDVAGKIAGDFAGRTVKQSSHPAMVILALINSTSGSQTLARRLYRTFAREDTETVHQEDLRFAFDNDEESDAAFTMFDKDLNGDISMEELEAVCVEIGRERKAITASLKDLDSVVGKLDDCLLFAVVIISVLVFISLISTSAAGVLTSAGSTVLALSWLLQATAQEFLQSLIFVFVKHPFDVGDRVTIYGNTGSTLKGDDYFVKEISLLYTEFKKMEGHVVQAPNSYLNTLFILNQRRSGGLAEAVPIIWKFGTTLDQIDGVRQKLLEFVRNEKREYQPNILTELRDVTEAHSISLNIVFFFKSNWQNEGLRLQRRNKFICALMIAMQEMGIEGPNMRFPGQRESFPVYMQHLPYTAERAGRGGHPDNPHGLGALPTYQEASIYQEPASAIPHEPDVPATIYEEHEPSPRSPQQPFPIQPFPVSTAFPLHQPPSATADNNSNLDRIRSPSGATTSASVGHHPSSATNIRRRGPSILDTSGRARAESHLRRERPRNESIAQIGRRMDLSLGIEGHTASNHAGDVFDDRDRDSRSRARIPISRVPLNVNVTSPSTSRARGDSMSTHRRPSHGSVDTTRTSDRNALRKSILPTFGPGLLNRVGTDGPRGNGIHRNRFLGSGAVRHSAENERPGNGLSLQFGRELRDMESGLAGIQEVATPGYHLGGGSPEDNDRRLGYGSSSLDHGVGQLANGSTVNTNLDPRSGLVSSAAVRMDTNDANEEQTETAERAPDGRPLFRATRLGSPVADEDMARSMGIDAETLAGVLAGSKAIADLEARAKGRGRGMTSDTAGTGVDPLHMGRERQQQQSVSAAGRSASRGVEGSVQARSASRGVDATTGAGAGTGLQPTVTSLSQADTEEAVTPLPRENNA